MKRDLQKHHAFWQQLQRIASMDGQVLRDVQTTDPHSGKAKTVTVVAARIDKLGLLFEDTAKHGAALSYTANLWPQEAKDATMGTKKADAAFLIRANLQQSGVEQAIQFLSRAQALYGSIGGMWAVHQFQLSRAGKSNALRRSLERWAGPAPNGLA